MRDWNATLEPKRDVRERARDWEEREGGRERFREEEIENMYKREMERVVFKERG
jgi:hypothetical protein